MAFVACTNQCVGAIVKRELNALTLLFFANGNLGLHSWHDLPLGLSKLNALRSIKDPIGNGDQGYALDFPMELFVRIGDRCDHSFGTRANET